MVQGTGGYVGVVGAALLAVLVGRHAYTGEWLLPGGRELLGPTPPDAPVPSINDVLPIGHVDGKGAGLPSELSAHLSKVAPRSSPDGALTSTTEAPHELRGLTLTGRSTKRHSLSLRQEYNVSYGDVVVSIVTSSATIGQRLPALLDAWVRGAPFPVVVITDDDVEGGRGAWESELDVRRLPCSPKINGLICKTRSAFEIMHREYRAQGRRWFLRLMDDTLVIPPNLLHALKRVDPDKPWWVPVELGARSHALPLSLRLPPRFAASPCFVLCRAGVWATASRSRARTSRTSRAGEAGA
jgi:hypothetical protein